MLSVAINITGFIIQDMHVTVGLVFTYNGIALYMCVIYLSLILIWQFCGLSSGSPPN